MMAPLRPVRRLSRQLSTVGGGYLGTGHRHPAVVRGAPRVLVTGACGQIGVELVPCIRARYGASNVIATDVRSPGRDFFESGPFHYLDVCCADQLARIALEHSVDTVVHLASLLSASGERNPQLALKVNQGGTEAVLELARVNGLRVFAPSSIAVFGPSTPRDAPTEDTIMRPTTIYGLTKLSGELLGEYYHARWGVDYRSLRYPGVVSAAALPGGGTTDYAVEIFYEVYMDDLLQGTVALLEADNASLTRRVYNMGGLSFSPKELVVEIQNEVPDFFCTFEPDFRQQIADSWPRSIDDSAARRDWNWKPEFDLHKMAIDILRRLRAKIQSGQVRPGNVGVDAQL